MKAIVAHIATAIATLLIVRAYIFWFVLPAASQKAFIERTKDLAELVSHLDQRYIRHTQTNSVDHITNIRKN